MPWDFSHIAECMLSLQMPVHTWESYLVAASIELESVGSAVTIHRFLRHRLRWPY